MVVENRRIDDLATGNVVVRIHTGLLLRSKLARDLVDAERERKAKENVMIKQLSRNKEYSILWSDGSDGVRGSKNLQIQMK